MITEERRVAQTVENLRLLELAKADGITNTACINSYMLVLDLWEANELHSPSLSYLDDGTICGYWRNGKDYASIDFELDGEFCWAMTDGDEVNAGLWNTHESREIPIALLTMIKRIQTNPKKE